MKHELKKKTSHGFPNISLPSIKKKNKVLLLYRTDGNLLSCDAIVDHFEKFGTVLNVSKYSIYTGIPFQRERKRAKMIVVFCYFMSIGRFPEKSEVSKSFV